MSRKTKKATDDKAEKDSKAKAQLEELILSGLQMPGLTFGRTIMNYNWVYLDKSGYGFLELNLQVPFGRFVKIFYREDQSRVFITVLQTISIFAMSIFQLTT